MLASEPASWQRQEQSPEPDRAHRWRGLGTADRVAHGSDELAQMLATLLVMRALAAWRQGGQAQAPYTPYSLENVHDRGGDGIGADGGKAGSQRAKSLRSARASCGRPIPID